nr:hypothetical protein [Streptomyces aurantiacus]
MIAAAQPVPGTTADAHAWRDSGLAEHCQGVTALGDGVHLNCGMVVPHRKRPGGPILPGEGEDNATHRKVRVGVRVIGRMKNYKASMIADSTATAFTMPSGPSPTCTVADQRHARILNWQTKKPPRESEFTVCCRTCFIQRHRVGQMN